MEGVWGKTDCFLKLDSLHIHQTFHDHLNKCFIATHKLHLIMFMLKGLIINVKCTPIINDFKGVKMSKMDTFSHELFHTRNINKKDKWIKIVM